MAKIELNKTKKIIIAVAAVIVVLLIAGSSYCIATEQNPIEAAQTIFSSNEEKLVGKWQSQSSPGLSAYVFYDDGTYDSYLSTVNFSGNYTVKGNKVTLVNPETSKEITYKFKVNGKVLSLTLVEEDSKKNDNNEVIKFDLVDELNQKTLTDIIGELAKDNNTTEEAKD